MAIKDLQNVLLRNNLFPDFIFGLHSTSQQTYSLQVVGKSEIQSTLSTTDTVGTKISVCLKEVSVL